eukprot:scaffold207_cov409-Prasinococcus_capsulatus_cf.AAC.66
MKASDSDVNAKLPNVRLAAKVAARRKTLKPNFGDFNCSSVNNPRPSIDTIDRNEHASMCMLVSVIGCGNLGIMYLLVDITPTLQASQQVTTATTTTAELSFFSDSPVGSGTLGSSLTDVAASSCVVVAGRTWLLGDIVRGVPVAPIGHYCLAL